MRPMRLVMLLIVLVLAGCGHGEPVIDPGDGGDYRVRLDPSEFVATIDNPWLPLMPGSRWLYEAGGGASNEVLVTHQTRQVMGITATVVRDVETHDGELVEETSDWYAQHRATATSGTWARTPRRTRTAPRRRPGPGRPASTGRCRGSS